MTLDTKWFVTLAASLVALFACAADVVEESDDAGKLDGGQDIIEAEDATAPDLPVGCDDLDLDGSPGTGACDPSGANFDCDDENPDVGPRVVEVCNQIDDDCDGAIDEGLQNACGGCEILVLSPGQVCGECGRVECDANDPDATVCTEGLGNICGGCEALSAVPGETCGVCGEIACADDNDVGCLDPGLNACGACGTLDAVPTTACGECGTWRCGPGGTAVECDDPLFNACGGCGELEAAPDSGCGACGTWTCSDDNTEVVCTGADENACGGCGLLDGAPNSACGACGQWVCNEDDSQVICTGADTNACGGCGGLAGAPGTSCGMCKTWECSSGTTVCLGPEPQTYFRDADRDGWGLAEDATSACAASYPYTSTQSGDCNDSSALQHPNHAELCDGINNDCDGATDENNGDCSPSEYCLSGSCAPMPTATWDPGCIDLGSDFPPGYFFRYTISGRANAPVTISNLHAGCGTPATSTEHTLDGNGNYVQQVDTHQASTDCNSDNFGTWDSWGTVDGRESNHVSAVYYNSQCAGVTTCAQAVGNCP